MGEPRANFGSHEGRRQAALEHEHVAGRHTAAIPRMAHDPRYATKAGPLTPPAVTTEAPLPGDPRFARAIEVLYSGRHDLLSVAEARRMIEDAGGQTESDVAPFLPVTRVVVGDDGIAREQTNDPANIVRGES